MRGVWTRQELTTCYQRLLRLEAHAQDHTLAPSDEQIRLLERHSCEFRIRHVETHAPGERLNQDTFPRYMKVEAPDCPAGSLGCRLLRLHV